MWIPTFFHGFGLYVISIVYRIENSIQPISNKLEISNQ